MQVITAELSSCDRFFFLIRVTFKMGVAAAEIDFFLGHCHLCTLTKAIPLKLPYFLSLVSIYYMNIIFALSLFIQMMCVCFPKAQIFCLVLYRKVLPISGLECQQFMILCMWKGKIEWGEEGRGSIDPNWVNEGL